MIEFEWQGRSWRETDRTMSELIVVRCATCGNWRYWSPDPTVPQEDPCECRPLVEQGVLPLGDWGPTDG